MSVSVPCLKLEAGARPALSRGGTIRLEMHLVLDGGKKPSDIIGGEAASLPAAIALSSSSRAVAFQKDLAVSPCSLPSLAATSRTSMVCRSRGKARTLAEDIFCTMRLTQRIRRCSTASCLAVKSETEP